MAVKIFPKIGLALGSGGAKGLAHIGVIKTLEKYNIPIDYIAGSSIGSMIGAHYAAHKDIRKLEDLILGFNRSKGFQLYDPTWKGGLVKGKKTEHFITEILEGATFENVKIPYAAIATDLNTAQPVILTRGDIVKAVRASISVPAFFQPVFYNKRLLSDGGLSNPVPADIVRSMGADIVIAVNLDTVYLENVIDKIPPLSKVPMHSINILRHNLALHSSKSADVIIAPKDILQVGLVGWNYFFSTEKAKTIIHTGEEAAEDKIREIEHLFAERIEEKTGISRIVSLIKKVQKFRRK